MSLYTLAARSINTRTGNGADMSRHRWSAGAFIALAAVLNLGLAGCVNSLPSNSPTPTGGSTPAAAPTTPAAATSPPLPIFLGPTGYGSLKLGFTKAMAVASGKTMNLAPGPGGCGSNDGYLAGS